MKAHKPLSNAEQAGLSRVLSDVETEECSHPAVMSAPEMARFTFVVNVMPKPGLLDPAGRALVEHGRFPGLTEARVGKRFEVTFEAPDAETARQMAEEIAGFLANPLIETHEIEDRP